MAPGTSAITVRLPVAITGFSALSIIARVPLSATLTRGAELVTRNSVYRAGYELLYAPLPAPVVKQIEATLRQITCSGKPILAAK